MIYLSNNKRKSINCVKFMLFCLKCKKNIRVKKHQCRVCSRCHAVMSVPKSATMFDDII